MFGFGDYDTSSNQDAMDQLQNQDRPNHDILVGGAAGFAMMECEYHFDRELFICVCLKPHQDV